jgi:hypothetical protein
MLNASDIVSLPHTKAPFTARRGKGVARGALPLVALLGIGATLMARSSQGAPPDLAAPGTLDIDSVPASHVLIDGRPLGATPRIRESVSPGAHVVAFVYSPNVSCRQSIQVLPGATATVMDRLGAPSTPGRRCRGEVTSPR